MNCPSRRRLKKNGKKRRRYPHRSSRKTPRRQKHRPLPAGQRNVARESGHGGNYAYITAALLDLFECTFEVKWLDFASELQLQTIQDFYDDQNGGFFT